MAGDAIFKFGNALVEMNFGRFSSLMGVAVITGVFGIGLGVAALARYLALVAMLKWEGMASQFGWRPGRCGVTADTIGPK
jgi:hypothetical protein